MKILQIIARPFSACFLGQNFRSDEAGAASMDFRQGLKEKPRPMKTCSEGPVMINRKRVNPSLDIGEILQKKRGHIGINLRALGNRQIGTRATPRSLAFLTPCRLG